MCQKDSQGWSHAELHSPTLFRYLGGQLLQWHLIVATWIPSALKPELTLTDPSVELSKYSEQSLTNFLVFEIEKKGHGRSWDIEKVIHHVDWMIRKSSIDK